MDDIIMIIYNLLEFHDKLAFAATDRNHNDICKVGDIRSKYIHKKIFESGNDFKISLIMCAINERLAGIVTLLGDNIINFCRKDIFSYQDI